MTLQIQNIYYDHGQESRIYERGVYSIDSTTKRIHIHDGVTPNGIEMPIMADLNRFANKNLSNVTQEDITNMLTNFGAMNMNTSSPITTVQKDNVYGKLYLDGIKSNVALPASNFLKINSGTRKVEAQDTSVVPTYFPCIDTSQPTYARAINTSYTASRHCMVTIRWDGVNVVNGPRFSVDGVEVWAMYRYTGDRSTALGAVNSHFVAAGSTYQVTGASVVSIVEYGVKKLTF